MVEARVDQLEVALRRIAEAQTRADERIDRFEASVEQLVAAIQQLTDQVTRLTGRIERMGSRVDALWGEMLERRRAEILARAAGGGAIPVVAGEEIIPEVDQRGASRGVWRVLDGRAAAPQET